MATSGGDIGNKYRQLPWYGSNEKREMDCNMHVLYVE